MTSRLDVTGSKGTSSIASNVVSLDFVARDRVHDDLRDGHGTLA